MRPESEVMNPAALRALRDKEVGNTWPWRILCRTRIKFISDIPLMIRQITIKLACHSTPIEMGWTTAGLW